MKNFGKREIMITIGLFIAILAVGYYSISSSEYLDVSQLKGIKFNANIIVEGRPVDMGYNTTYLLTINDTVFNVVFYGSYGIAEKTGQGSFVGEDSYAVFILSGKNSQDQVIGIYSAREFRQKYGMKVSVEDKVVIEGQYYPSLKGTLINPITQEKKEYNIVIVSSILQGCHSSYEGEVGKISSSGS